MYMEPNIQTPLHNPRMVICSEGDQSVMFKFEATYISLLSGQLPEDSERFHELVKTLLPGSGYFLCSGLPADVASMLTYETKSARKWGLPFDRVDHKECLMWLNTDSAPGSSRKQPQRCHKCSQLMYYVRRESRKRALLSAEHKAARIQTSSHYPMKYLSPASLQKRRSLILQEKKALKRKVCLRR